MDGDITPLSRRDPNVGFICTVESELGGTVYREYPLQDIVDALFNLEKIAADDTKTVHYLEKCVPPSFGPNLSFEPNFLVPESYTSRYCGNVRDPMKSGEHLDANVVAMQSGPEYYIETVVGYGRRSVMKRVPVPKSVYHEWRLSTRNRDRKRLFMRNLWRYALSVNYVRGMREHGIIEKYHGKKILMYSTDTIGWTTYRYQITNDIAFRFDSNFGYGNSAYFFLTLTYKGVEIVPFSAYVRYRFANARTLMEHTYQYAVERQSWRPALQYVAETANAAAIDPERFVKERIWNEVTIMIDGLKQIMSCRDLHEMVFAGDNDDNEEDPPYLGVAIGTNFRKMRAVKINETLVMIKAEKAVGALCLLHRLRTFSSIVIEVSSAIATIIAMIKDVLPEVLLLIESVSKEILTLKNELAALEKDILKIDCEITEMDEKLNGEEERIAALKHEDGICERQSVGADVETLVEKLREDKKLLERRREQKENDRETRSIYIHDRERFLSDLEHCYGAGVAGDRFLEVIDALEPHLMQIEKQIAEEERQMDGKFDVNGLRLKVTARYRAEHPDIEPLVKLRDAVLSEIDGLYYFQDKQ